MGKSTESSGGSGGGAPPGGANQIGYGNPTATAYTSSPDLTYDPVAHEYRVSAAEAGGEVKSTTANTAAAASSHAVVEASTVSTGGDPIFRLSSGDITWELRVDQTTNTCRLYRNSTLIAVWNQDGQGMFTTPGSGYSLDVRGAGLGSVLNRFLAAGASSTNMFDIVQSSGISARHRTNGNSAAGTLAGLNRAKQYSVTDEPGDPAESFVFGFTQATGLIAWITNNLVRMLIRADGNVVIGPTISGGVDATALGTGAAGQVYIKEGTPPSTNPTGGGDLGSASGAATFIGSSGQLNYLSGRQVQVADANSTATAGDRCTVHTATLTANRTVGLPNAATVPDGWKHRVFSPLNMGGFNITVSGDINIGSAASFVITTAETGVEFEKCGSTWRAI